MAMVEVLKGYLPISYTTFQRALILWWFLEVKHFIMKNSVDLVILQVLLHRTCIWAPGIPQKIFFLPFGPTKNS
jgi:hypothetical protein